MNRQDLPEIAAFATIARERSFTRAAARLDVTASALSHALGGLESRLGVRLLNRTTRSVAPTEAGARLLERVEPALDEIGEAVAALAAGRDRPAGHLRISAYRASIDLIAPQVFKVRKRYPDIQIEVAVDDGLTDIVAAGFDAGIRPGEMVAKDMIVVRLSPDDSSVVVGSPAYLAERGAPQSFAELRDHDCIAYRYVSTGALHRWKFAKNGEAVSIAVTPSFVANDMAMIIRAALDGVGLAYVARSLVARELAAGALTEVLEPWRIPLTGAFLYYASARTMPPALKILVQALRYRPARGNAKR